jgi:CRP/FNR family transcriptional regulator
MISNLIQHITNYVQLSDKDVDILKSFVTERSLRKKETLLEEGNKCHANYFVSKGCLRSYFINPKGDEQILQFAIENWWISDYESLVKNSNSTLYIQAVEDCKIVAFSSKDEEGLYNAIPQLERYFRLIYQKAYMAAILRTRYLYEYSREELYRHFLNNFPEFVQRIPNYMLASYLGFSPEYLSEIRKKIVS